jgi:hypothetical protein
MPQNREPDETTQMAEPAEEDRAHTADRPATAEESSVADQEAEQEGEDERRQVAEHFQEMNEIGANAKGEGRVE